MKVSVIYFSLLQNLTGKRGEYIDLAEESTAEKLFLSLAERYPELTQYRKYLRLAVNQEYQPFETVLQDDDEVVFITPVSGG